MKLEGDFFFEAGVQDVWRSLLDPVVLAAVMPGCEKLEFVDGRYLGELNIKIGPVQGKFAGIVELKDVNEPVSYTMVIDGRGAPGFVKATAGIKLAPDGVGTRMTYDADALVGGKIASIGQRLVDASAKAITKQSLEGLHENIKARSTARASHALAPHEATPATPVDPPVIRADPAVFAANVAKEVTTSLFPAPVRYAFAVLVGVFLGSLGTWLLLRR
jgi:hypothetical protein